MNDLFTDRLPGLGFNVRFRYSIVSSTMGTTKESTIAKYVASFLCDAHRVTLHGHVYVIGDESFVSARVLSSLSCRAVLVGVPDAVSNVNSDFLMALGNACGTIRSLAAAGV